MGLLKSVVEFRLYVARETTPNFPLPRTFKMEKSDSLHFFWGFFVVVRADERFACRIVNAFRRPQLCGWTVPPTSNRQRSEMFGSRGRLSLLGNRIVWYLRFLTMALMVFESMVVGLRWHGEVHLLNPDAPPVVCVACHL